MNSTVAGCAAGESNNNNNNNGNVDTTVTYKLNVVIQAYFAEDTTIATLNAGAHGYKANIKADFVTRWGTSQVALSDFVAARRRLEYQQSANRRRLPDAQLSFSFTATMTYANQAAKTSATADADTKMAAFQEKVANGGIAGSKCSTTVACSATVTVASSGPAAAATTGSKKSSFAAGRYSLNAIAPMLAALLLLAFGTRA